VVISTPLIDVNQSARPWWSGLRALCRVVVDEQVREGDEPHIAHLLI
jgi:hypothetical protein